MKKLLKTTICMIILASMLCANAFAALSDISAKSAILVLTRKSDCDALKKTAAECFKIDALANDLYNLATDENNNEYQMLIV